MSKAPRSTKSKSYRLSRIAENRQRISRSFDAEEQERQRLIRLTKELKQPVVEI